jgi:hypothetical protein
MKKNIELTKAQMHWEFEQACRQRWFLAVERHRAYLERERVRVQKEWDDERNLPSMFDTVERSN